MHVFTSGEDDIRNVFFSSSRFSFLYWCCMLLGAVQCLVYTYSVRTDKTIFIESINVGRDLGWNIIYCVLCIGIDRKSLVLSDDDHYYRT